MNKLIRVLTLTALLLGLSHNVRLNTKTRTSKARLDSVKQGFTEFSLRTSRNYKSTEEYKKAQLAYVRNSAKVEAAN